MEKLTPEEIKLIEDKRAAESTIQAVALRKITELAKQVEALRLERQRVYKDATVVCAECDGRGGKHGSYSFINEEHPWYTCDVCKGNGRIWIRK